MLDFLIVQQSYFKRRRKKNWLLFHVLSLSQCLQYPHLPIIDYCPISLTITVHSISYLSYSSYRSYTS